MRQEFISVQREAGAGQWIRDDQVVIRPLSLDPDQVVPRMIQASGPNVNLSSWVMKNRAEFEKFLTECGGILLRGFGISSAGAFHEFMKCFNTEPLPYMFRSSPRKELDTSIKNIYLSTSYPNTRHINMHNESSYSRVWGKKIIFCCLKPAHEGGETPIADTRRVLKDIDCNLVNKFRAMGVKYRRNLSPDFGMPWQEVFQTMDIGVAKEVCRRYQINYEIEGNHNFIIEWVKPAVYKHSISQEETWFNHILFFNKFSRYEELGVAFEDEVPAEYLASDTFFGDGSIISPEEYLEIKRAYQKNLVVFPYEQGDILFLDNMLTAHGRNPYKGDRVVGTAIIEAAYDDERYK
jgi:alpha-ketoglutarate-dependent taurine dioxygenase